MSRKKDRNEPSFKRSESFKRISIRKSYLDRGKRRNKINKTLDVTNNVVNQVITNCRNEDDGSMKKDRQITCQFQDNCYVDNKDSISYDEWLQGVNGSASREKIHLDEGKTHQSQGVTVVNFIIDNDDDLKERVKKKLLAQETLDEITDDLKVLEINTASFDGAKEEGFEDVEGGPPSVSINFGRIWRDAVPVPSSSSSSSLSSSQQHRSLDSALKDRKSQQANVARTVSAPQNTTSKDGDHLTSFGFSLKFNKLADFRAGLLLFLMFPFQGRWRNFNTMKLNRLHLPDIVIS